MRKEIKSLINDLKSGDDQQAEQAVAELMDYGLEPLPALQEMLISFEEDSRWWAVRCLAQMENPPLHLLIGSLGDISQEVRQCAALALSHHPDNDAIPQLLKLIGEPDSVTANLASTALIAIGKDAIPSLLDILPDLKDIGRIEAYRAIASIVDERAISVLMNAFDVDSVAINYWAEEGLNRLGLDFVYLKPE